MYSESRLEERVDKFALQLFTQHDNS